jgi:hypothetical protein
MQKKLPHITHKPTTTYRIIKGLYKDLQSNEEPCMKFLLIIILQEPKEFGVTTSHMFGGGGHKWAHDYSLSSHYRPSPQPPKFRYISNFYHPCYVCNSKPQTAVFVIYLMLGVVGDGTN